MADDDLVHALFVLLVEVIHCAPVPIQDPKVEPSLEVVLGQYLCEL
jgi:hypothetical protein